MEYGQQSHYPGVCTEPLLVISSTKSHTDTANQRKRQTDYKLRNTASIA